MVLWDIRHLVSQKNPPQALCSQQKNRAFDDCWSNGYHSICLSQVSTSHHKFPICHPTPASKKSAQAYASLVFLILPSRFWILLIICLSLSYHINSWNGLTWKVGLGPLGTLGTLECFLHIPCLKEVPTGVPPGLIKKLIQRSSVRCVEINLLVSQSVRTTIPNSKPWN